MKKEFFCLAAVLFMAACLHAQTAINQSSIGFFPYVITQPGSYILTSNITVPAGETGIEIGVSNVTLNLNGYSISGPLTCSGSTCSSNIVNYGVYSPSGLNNTTIENGSIRGFYICGELNSGSAHDLTISSCYQGLYGLNAIAKGNVISNSVYAMLLNYSMGSENVLFSNYYGVISNGSSLINNSIYGNLSWGMYLWSGFASGNSLINNGSDLGYASVAVASNNACTNGAC